MSSTKNLSKLYAQNYQSHDNLFRHFHKYDHLFRKHEIGLMIFPPWKTLSYAFVTNYQNMFGPKTQPFLHQSWCPPRHLHWPKQMTREGAIIAILISSDYFFLFLKKFKRHSPFVDYCHRGHFANSPGTFRAACNHNPNGSGAALFQAATHLIGCTTSSVPTSLKTKNELEYPNMQKFTF